MVERTPERSGDQSLDQFGSPAKPVGLIVGLVVSALILATALVGCAGSVADDGVTETIAPRPTSTPFPTLAPAPPATAVAEAAVQSAEETVDATSTLAQGAVAAAAEAAAGADPNATPDLNSTASELGDLDLPAGFDPNVPAAFTTKSKVTTVGLDEVYFGMTANEASDAADSDWIRSSPSTDCTFLTPLGGPAGVRFWLWEGSVERVDVTNPGITTPSGFGVGTPLATLQERLSENLQVGEASTGGRRAVFVPSDDSDAEFRIIFEIGEDDMVTRYRSGRLGVVELDASNCS